MKNLREAYVFCREICKELNIPIADVIAISDKKLSGKWGVCMYNRMYDKYSIEINSILLDDENPDESLYQTLLHEMLHTCPRCLDHGSVWKGYASRINAAYNLGIKRTNTTEELKLVKKIEKKYVLECPCCHSEFGYDRMCKAVEHYDKYWCVDCGKEKGRLVRVK